MTQDAEPVVIRRCDICGKDRILNLKRPTSADTAQCGCGVTPLNDADLKALEGRGP